MKISVGKEIVDGITKKCLKCKANMHARNGMNSIASFFKGAINWWQCPACHARYEAIIKWN